jgi:hypothetical protein
MNKSFHMIYNAISGKRVARTKNGTNPLKAVSRILY